MRILVIGAGQVGSTVVEALRGEHEIAVVDLHPERLSALSYRYDVRTIVGDAASRRVLQDAGITETDLLIACTARDEVNVIASLFSKKLSPATKTIVRTANAEYLDVWREHQLEADFIVSSELETANAISRLIGVPAARQTDVFAEGQVQIVEFDVPTDSDALAQVPLTRAALRRARRSGHRVVGLPLREASIPADSRVAGIIRGGAVRVAGGAASIEPGDRVIVIGSPSAAREWSALMAPARKRVDDVVLFGCGRTGLAIARALLEQDMPVRIVEEDPERAREVAASLPRATVFNATGMEADFLERERIGDAGAAVFAIRDDAKNHYAATLAKVHGVSLTIAVIHEAASAEVFERAGVDVTVDPRSITAEEIVRFAHDPRTQQVAMLEGDRFEVLDITVRAESRLVGIPFRKLPMTGHLIGAIVRNGDAIFPHGDETLHAGDRAIIFTEASRVSEVEEQL